MRNIVVTGGSRGLGLGIVCKLGGEGYRAIAIARAMNDGLASAIEAGERERPGSIHFVPFDLSEVQELPGLVKKLRKEFGPIHGLVNNAGLGTDGSLALMHNAQIERLIRLNTL